MSTELKNCPFCGSEDCYLAFTVKCVPTPGGWYSTIKHCQGVVHCLECGAKAGSPWFEHIDGRAEKELCEKAKAIARDRWNTRAGQEWLPVESYDKETCPEVLLSIYDTETKRKFLIIGHFIPRFSTEYYDDFGDDRGERKPDPDDDGISYCPEGWYEAISSNACDYASFMISEKWTVLCWMPLPKAPEIGHE